MSSSALSSFPPAVREAQARWLEHRDPAALDAVVLAVVAFHRPRREGSPAGEAALPDSARLIDDLGYDSLALAEVVFFVEDLYQVTISNEDLKAIATVADLRAYVRARISA
jgi:acyl carrier protein